MFPRLTRVLTHAAAALAIALLLISCGSSGGGSTDSSPTTPSTSTSSVRVKTTDALTAAATVGVSVSGSGLTGGATDASGALTVTTTSTATPFSVSLSAAAYLTRTTLLKVPGNDITLSLIPASFDVTSFNQMFRTDFLTRWTSAPPLRILSNVVEFSGDGTSSTFAVLAETLTSEEIASVTSDLSSGIQALSNGTFTNFASTSTFSATPGGTVTLVADGSVTFARCHGLTAARGSGGFALWNFRSDGVVTGSMLCVDRDYDLNAAGTSTFRRGVRIHELGHALGAQHVTTSTVSLMNPTVAVNELTVFDQQAVKIAYARTPGNRAPDADPSGYTVNRLTVRQASAPVCPVKR